MQLLNLYAAPQKRQIAETALANSRRNRGRPETACGRKGQGRDAYQRPERETKGEGEEGVKGPVFDALMLGLPRDMRNSHLHHTKAVTDGSETHPLTNLEWHVQRIYWVTRKLPKGKWGIYL